METLIDFLEKYQVGTWLISVSLFLYLIVNLASDGEVIKNLINQILHVGNTVYHFYLKIRKKKYEEVLSSEDFLIFEKKCMFLIYKPLINRLRASHFKIELVHLDWLREENGSCPEYEAIAIASYPGQKFPFDDMFPEELLQLKKPENEKVRLNISQRYAVNLWEKLSGREHERIRRYRRWMSIAIKHPNRIGYMLDQMEFNADGSRLKKVTTHCEYYLSNILESHILEYEIYCFYQRCKYWPNYRIKKWKRKILTERINDIFRESLMKELPIRKTIHSLFKEKEEEVLRSGEHRNSLLGVQIMVLLKNRSNSYDVVTIRRSMDVVAKPGFIQYIPSGGFEAANDKNDIDTQRSNYSIHKILFRELAEECFGMRENIDWERMSPENVYYQECIKQLQIMLTNNEAEMEYVGTTMNLVGLRQELSFILKIDCEAFAEKLVCNYESASTLNLIDIRKLEKQDYWVDNTFNDIKMLNCTSAGLLMLARKNHLYQEALVGSQIG